MRWFERQRQAWIKERLGSMSQDTDALRQKLSNVLCNFHRNSCYPEAEPTEVNIAADAILRVLATRTESETAGDLEPIGATVDHDGKPLEYVLIRGYTAMGLPGIPCAKRMLVALEKARAEELAALSTAPAPERRDEWQPMLRSAMCLLHGLQCSDCGQGREMAAKCCRDADCPAGWCGIGADEVKDWLEAAERLMPGTLAEIENPSEPVNEEALRTTTAPAEGERT